MSEYEIFNNDNENIEVIPENKKAKKAKKPVVKEKVKNEFFTNLFRLELLPMFLAIGAIFFSLFVKFLPIYSLVAASAFFFIGFAFVFSALIIEIVNMIKGKKLQFNLNILLIGIAFFTLYI